VEREELASFSKMVTGEGRMSFTETMTHLGELPAAVQERALLLDPLLG